MHTHDLSDWAHTHVFDEGNRRAEKNARLVLALTMVVMAVEIWAGWRYNSMALPALAALWSLWLGGSMLFALPGASRTARLTALAYLAAAIGGVVLPWVYLFYVW